MIRYFNIAAFCVLTCISCSSNSRYKYSIEKNNSGFEVYILKDQVNVIQQKYWPGLAGNQTISSEKEAEKLAKLFIEKLDKGIFPPTVTPKEVDNIRLRSY